MAALAAFARDAEMTGAATGALQVEVWDGDLCAAYVFVARASLGEPGALGDPGAMLRSFPAADGAELGGARKYGMEPLRGTRGDKRGDFNEAT